MPTEEKKTNEEDKGSDEEADSKDKGTKPNVGNGGVTDTYEWTQTLAELNVNIFLPQHVKAKDLIVLIKQKHLKVCLKATPNDPIIDGDLHKMIKMDETIWAVEEESDRKILQISFEKHD